MIYIDPWLQNPKAPEEFKGKTPTDADIVLVSKGNYDHSGSAVDLIKASKLVPSAIPGEKEPIKEELITMNFAFASVVSKTFIKKGSRLNKQNICLKRPGNGSFLAKDFLKLLGKKTIRDIPSNMQIRKNYIK